ncbi:hypothetical protein FACS189472_05730 [Alphaproteobacteria bacterium]|nr:hypothetical protein FACS189472_05730 [Alphaproteobacteria bacterium]
MKSYERDAAVIYYNAKRFKTEVLNLAKDFAKACIEKEGTGAEITRISPLVVDGSKGGIQNGGIYKVETSGSKNYIVKFGKINEFSSSKKLHNLLKTKAIPPQVKFAYPRYIQSMIESPTGKKVFVNKEGNPINEESLEAKCEAEELTYQLSTLCSFDAEELPAENGLRVLLFMDEAVGVPGDTFAEKPSLYPKDKLKDIYKNLAISANTLTDFICPDDNQNTSNLIVNPDNGDITYIDFDNLHFYEGGTYRSLSGGSKNFDWYLSMLNNQDMEVQYAFYEAANPELKDMVSGYIRPFPPAFVAERYDPECQIHHLDYLSYPNYYRSYRNNKLQISDWERLETILPVIEKYYENKNKIEILKNIKKDVEIFENSPKIACLSQMNMRINVFWSEFYITEDEMWSICLSQILNPEEKALLERMYLLNIPKPLIYAIAIPELKTQCELILNRKEMSLKEFENIAQVYKKHMEAVLHRENPYGGFYETKINVLK